jgi:hypothetical protein
VRLTISTGLSRARAPGSAGICWIPTVIRKAPSRKTLGIVRRRTADARDSEYPGEAGRILSKTYTGSCIEEVAMR